MLCFYIIVSIGEYHSEKNTTFLSSSLYFLSAQAIFQRGTPYYFLCPQVT